MSIGRRLTILFLSITAIPIIFISLLGYVNAKRDIGMAAIASMKIVARGQANAIQEYLSGTRRTAQDMASGAHLRKSVERILQSRDASEKKRRAEQLSEYLKNVKLRNDPNLNMIHVLDLEGLEIAGSDSARLFRAEDRSQPYFLRGQKDTYIQSPMMHEHFGMKHSFMPVATPIRSMDGSTVVAVLMLGYSLDHVKDILYGVTGKSISEINVAGSSVPIQMVLGNTDKSLIVEAKAGEAAEGRVDQITTAPFLACIDEGRELAGEWRDLHGVPIVGASSCMQIEDDWRWVLVAKQHRAVVVAPARRQMSLGAVIGFLTLSMVWLVAVTTNRAIAKPLADLMRGAEVIGSGNLDHKVGTDAEDEIGALSRAFDKMTADLKNVMASRDDLSREVHERERVEEELRKVMENLRRSNEELERFAYVASHDLQEPLRMIASYLQLLERRFKGKLDKDADEFIAFAVDGANRMQRLINDLLGFSRVGTRGKEFEPVEGELILRHALDNLATAVKESGAMITHEPLPKIMADDTQILQLFQNLIGNAIKFRGEAPPKIEIRVKEQEHEWLFVFQDNGIGIEKEYFERIFVIFQRLHGKEAYPGTGIGLAICKKIVERHGGRMWVESEPGKGSVFYFTLPKRTGEG